MLLSDEALYLDEVLLGADGRMRLLSAAELREYPHEDLLAWAVRHARYLLVSRELVEFLLQLVGSDPESALEIAAGQGDLGYHLGIRMTDAAYQTRPHVRADYARLRQAVTDPPPDVERLDAATAVRRYRPRVLIGSWVTDRVNEEALLARVETYVHIGNDGPHSHKSILSRPHEVIRAPWLFSRGIDPEGNSIRIWGAPPRRVLPG